MTLEETIEALTSLGIDVAILTWHPGRYGLHDPYEIVLTSPDQGLLAASTGTDLMGVMTALDSAIATTVLGTNE